MVEAIAKTTTTEISGLQRTSMRVSSASTERERDMIEGGNRYKGLLGRCSFRRHYRTSLDFIYFDILITDFVDVALLLAVKSLDASRKFFRARCRRTATALRLIPIFLAMSVNGSPCL